MLTAVAPTPAQEVAHRVVEDADLLALEAVEPADHVAAPEDLGRVAAERQQLGVPVLLHLPVDHVAIGIAGRAGLVGIERQAGEIAGLEARVVARHLGDVHRGEIHDAELQQPQHGLVVDAHLVERRHVGRDRALRGLRDGLAPERHLVIDRDRRRAVEADDLELTLRQVLRRGTGGDRGRQRQSRQQPVQHVQIPRPSPITRTC